MHTSVTQSARSCDLRLHGKNTFLLSKNIILLHVYYVFMYACMHDMVGLWAEGGLRAVARYRLLQAKRGVAPRGRGGTGLGLAVNPCVF